MFTKWDYKCFLVSDNEFLQIFSNRLNGDRLQSVARTGLGNKHDSDVRECNGKWVLATVVNR